MKIYTVTVRFYVLKNFTVEAECQNEAEERVKELVQDLTYQSRFFDLIGAYEVEE